MISKIMAGRAKKSSILLVVLLILAVTAVGCGSNQESAADSGDNAAEVIKLKVADIYPKTHYVSQGIQLWMERTTELTDGRVEFELYPSQQLGKAADMLDVVSTGVADVGYVPFPYFNGRMPLITGAGAISGIWSNCVEGNPAVWDTCTSDPVLNQDFVKNNIRPVLPFANQVFQLFTVDKPVQSLADIKGMKIRSSGGVMDDIITSFGAIPVQIPVGELYEALSRGTVDGSLISAVSLHSHKLDEVVNYCTWGVDVSGGIFGYAINEEVWQSLPEDVQQAMLQASQEALQDLGERMDADEAKQKQDFIDQGMDINELSPDDQQEWLDVQAPVKDKWIQEMKAQGLPGQDVLDALYAGIK